MASLDSEKLLSLPPESVPGTCHSRMPIPVPSWPAHLLRNVPLQPLGSCKHGVWFAQAVPSLRVAQVEGVSAQDKLQGEGQAEKPPSCPAPSLPCRTPLRTITSQRCPMIGASAHACSVLRPSWPFLKAMTVKDLSNHLQERRQEMQGGHRGGWRSGGGLLWGWGTTPVVAVAMQQGLAIEAEAGLVIRVVVVRLLVQGDKESSTLDGIQSSLVLARAEEGLACLCPLHSGGTGAG